MQMSGVNYEWDVELVDEHGDIQDHRHENKLSNYNWRRWGPLAKNERLVLVRDMWKLDPISGEASTMNRDWAYVEDGELPFTFGYNPTGYKVPKRFHTQFDRLKILIFPTVKRR